MGRESPSGWTEATFEDLLDYLQPSKYIVSSTEYDDNYDTPVLTAGKSFILGYTKETENVFNQLPAIIFDDFTTAIKFVNFPFKVKSSAMKILVPISRNVDIKYVYYYMETVKISSATHKRYWISTYSKISIPLPPLNEQHRIVAKIEELFTKLDATIAELKKIKQQIKRYRQSVLKAAFEGKLTDGWRRKHPDSNAMYLIEQIDKYRPSKLNKSFIEKSISKYEIPGEWKCVRIKDIYSLLTDYHSNGSYKNLKAKVTLLDKPDYAIMIRATNFEKNNFIDLAKYITKDAYEFMSKSKLYGREILIGKIGNAGKVYFMPVLDRPASLAMNLFALRFPEIINSKYIYYHLIGSFSTSDIKTHVKGVANVTIDKRAIRSLNIVLPSTNEQNEIVEEIESRFSIADKIEETVKENLKKTESLRQSILKKAFEGKLVPQDPTDEPAEKLLERIKAEKKDLKNNYGGLNEYIT